MPAGNWTFTTAGASAPAAFFRAAPARQWISDSGIGAPRSGQASNALS